MLRLAQPTDDLGGECGQLNKPNYVNNCDYDGAFSVLSKTIGPSIQQAVTGDTTDYVLRSVGVNCLNQ